MTLLSEAHAAVLRLVFHMRPPYGGTFAWFDPGTDFEMFRLRFLSFRTPHFWDTLGLGFPYFTYGAPLGVVYWLLYKLPHGLETYLALSIAALVVWAWYFSGQLAKRGIARTPSFALLLLMLAASLPIRIQLQDGNMEMVLAIVLGLGVMALSRGHWGMGAALIGVAGSMKIYPLLLLGVPLAQRRYKEFAGGLVATALTTVIGLAILGPSVLEAQHHINQGLAYIVERDGLSAVPNGLQFSHSLFAWVKIGVALFDHLRHAPANTEALRATMQARESLQFKAALSVYLPCVAIAGLAAYALRIWRMPFLNQVIALTLCAVLIPPNSFDYTLVQLLIPLGLLIVFAADRWQQGEQPRGLALCLGCFAVIFTTGDYFRAKYYFASQVRTLAMLVMLIAVMCYPLAARDERA
jgi:hypothetical protein